MITTWLDELVSFPAEYAFLKYLILGTLIIGCVFLMYSLCCGIISSLFNRR